MTTDTNNRNDAETLLKFGSAIGVPRSPVTADLERVIDPETGTPYLVAPDGYTVHDLEYLLPTPTRILARRLGLRNRDWLGNSSSTGDAERFS